MYLMTQIWIALGPKGLSAEVAGARPEPRKPPAPTLSLTLEFARPVCGHSVVHASDFPHTFEAAQCFVHSVRCSPRLVWKLGGLPLN